MEQGKGGDLVASVAASFAAPGHDYVDAFLLGSPRSGDVVHLGRGQDAGVVKPRDPRVRIAEADRHEQRCGIDGSVEERRFALDSPGEEPYPETDSLTTGDLRLSDDQLDRSPAAHPDHAETARRRDGCSQRAAGCTAHRGVHDGNLESEGAAQGVAGRAGVVIEVHLLLHGREDPVERASHPQVPSAQRGLR